ncbi:endonuclease [Hydrogenovibrio kuenenii]|uniref:endonuclease n=1 Tax=Hydrogenovibrio kuenenii TaxID=63658 RepID=UPI0012FF07EB|nr:endonuclease [Hydrogenovibrio kuenenii]
MRILFALLLGLTTITVQAGAPSSFSKAKEMLYTQVYPSHGYTIYTGCPWHITKGNKKVVDLEACGLANAFPKKQMKRAQRVEAEHVIPASWFLKKNGQWRQCAIDAKQHHKNARKYCQKHDPEYRRAHNDLVNLFPSVGQINADRSNKPYAEALSGNKEKTFRGQGENGRTIVITSRVAIPPKEIRGDVARIAFYYERTYGLKLSKRQNELFEQWSKIDPVSQEELARNDKIKRVQGWSNPLQK